MKFLLFGGSGYIGKAFQIFIDDKSECFATDLNDKLEHFCDVRMPIRPSICPFQPDWIILLAAIHREPGHQPSEYFETNIRGAVNVSNYASEVGCKNIFFMSSISAYGPTRSPTDESSLPMPHTPYGTSKLAAELILQGWQKESLGRRLIICRPGVVFGPNDPGNMGRLIKAIRSGYFFYSGNKKLKKSYAYITGLLESMFFTIKRKEQYILYNYVEKKTETLEDLAKIIAKEYNCRPPFLNIPIGLLVFAAHLLKYTSIGKSQIHPHRVKKSVLSTHIIPKWLINANFDFKWAAEISLKKACTNIS